MVKRWLPAREQFLLPVKALSIIFRAKFRDALQKTDLFDLVSADVWQADWVVHCQLVRNGTAALKYLAPYIFRVAISDNRLVSLKNDKVTIRYQDSKTRETQYCTLPAETFIQRFLQHVLPKGFMKVRYYGFFSAGNRKRFKQVKALAGSAQLPVTEDDSQLDIKDCATDLLISRTLRINIWNLR